MRENIDNKRVINTEAFWVDGSQIWISAMGYNGLFMYDIEKEETKFIGSFPMEEHNKWRLHGKAIKVNQEIYFIPDRSRYVHVYNLKTQQISSYFPGDCERMECKNAVYIQGKIYFISDASNIFLYSMDVDTKIIEKHLIDITDYSGGICSDMVAKENKLYLACRQLNKVIEYTLNSNSYRLLTVVSDGNGFGTMNYDGEFFWFSDNKGVLKWKKGSEKLERYEDFPSEFGMVMRIGDEIIRCKGFTNKYQPEEKPFSFSAIIHGALWLFPFRTNMIIKVDLLNGIMSEVRIESEEENERSLFMRTRLTHCRFMGGIQEGVLTFSSTTTKKIYICNEKNFGTDILSFLIRAKEPDDLGEYLHDYRLYQEEEDEILERFLMRIREAPEKSSEDKSNIGKNIYKKMREYKN